MHAGDRLRERIEELAAAGGRPASINQLAATIGMKGTTLRDQIKSGRLTRFARTAAAVGLNALWLEEGEGPRLASDNPRQHEPDSGTIAANGELAALAISVIQRALSDAAQEMPRWQFAELAIAIYQALRDGAGADALESGLRLGAYVASPPGTQVVHGAQEVEHDPERARRRANRRRIPPMG